MTLKEVYEKIGKISKEYDFPLEVLIDVEGRLNSNKDLLYAYQQLRYLENISKEKDA